MKWKTIPLFSTNRPFKKKNKINNKDRLEGVVDELKHINKTGYNMISLESFNITSPPLIKTKFMIKEKGKRMRF